MSIEFKSKTKTVQVLTSDGDPVTYKIEYRSDPLTSRVSVICPYLKEKWVEFYSVQDKDWLNKIIEESKENCLFCKPLIDEIAARFPKQQIEEDILRFDDIYVFPNLYPRADFEAVVTSPDIHYLDFSTINTDLLYSFLNASIECIKKAYQKNNKLIYPVIGCNYLPPAGASLIHFHLQVSIQEVPFHYVKTLTDSSVQYEIANHANFWLDLMNAGEDREIKRKNNIYWHVPFAPTGFCEVRAIINKPNMLMFTTEDVRDIAEGLSNILRYYDDHGFAAFNCVIYSGKLGAENNDFYSGIRIVARPNPRPNYTSIDSWYMPFLLGQTVVLEKPEDLSKEMRNYF